LIAATGLVAIASTNRDPAADLDALVDYLRAHGPVLGIDDQRIGLMGFSGNAPLALSVPMHGARPYVKCVALLYGFTLDLDGSTAVADASKQWGFVNACAGKTADDLPDDLALFIARAGKDTFAGLNDALDRFVAKALARNMRLTLTNHA